MNQYNDYFGEVLEPRGSSGLATGKQVARLLVDSGLTYATAVSALEWASYLLFTGTVPSKEAPPQPADPQTEAEG